MKIRNISCKALGAGSPSSRLIKAVISTHSIHLSFSDSPPISRYELPVQVLRGGEKTNLSLSAKVLPAANSYETLSAEVALYFSPPDKSDPCSIQIQNISIKVANTYQYDGKSDVLLVANCNTTVSEVDSWNSLICKQLKMKMDVYNISPSGGFQTILPENTDPQSIFSLYHGKVIVILGNQFPYFERGQRNALDIIDGGDFTPAVSCGTSLIVSGLANPRQQMHIPRLLRMDDYPQCHTFKKTKNLIKAVIITKNMKSFYETKFVCTPRKKGNDLQRCASKADGVAKELLRRVPNVRFSVIIAPPENGQEAGRIEVFPCVPYDSAKFLLTSASPKNQSGDLNGFCMLLCVPFSTRLETLWDKFCEPVVSQNETFTARLIGAVQFDLITELSRFASRTPPWPDNISEKHIFNYLKRLETFFLFDTNRQFSRSSAGPVTTILGNLMLMADHCTGSWPRVITFGTRRKRLCNKLKEMIDKFLISHYGVVKHKPIHLQYNQYIRTQSKDLKKEDLSKRKLRLLKTIMESIGVRVDGITSSPELIDVEAMGNVVRKAEDVNFAKHAEQLRNDLAHAKEQLREFSIAENSNRFSN